MSFSNVQRKKSENWDFLFIAIALLVAAFHVALAILVFQRDDKIIPKTQKSLLVTTISLKSEIKIEEKKQAPKESSTQTIAASPAKEVVKKEIVKAPVKKTASKKPEEKPNPKNQLSQKKKELLNRAKKNLEKVGKTENQKLPRELESKRQVGELNAEKIVLSGSQMEFSYKDEVAMVLKEKLKLPEFGDVEIKLGLKKNGEVELVEIMSSKSELNSAFIRSALFKIKFPPSKNDPKNVVLFFTLTSS